MPSLNRRNLLKSSALLGAGTIAGAPTAAASVGAGPITGSGSRLFHFRRCPESRGSVTQISRSGLIPIHRVTYRGQGENGQKKKDKGPLGCGLDI